ncbi:MAG: hypothetical protein PHT92_04220 [Bacteroidales bacterium]|jgi:hypothetical protein|nr:hypothetical protein [Bacteroidales bacterium]
MEVFDIEIPAHSTRREWAVYAIIAKHITINKTKIYVGKVGDNREGCNPIISRIGNHFSHNKIHSQLRNLIVSTTDYNYKVYYATFGEYSLITQKRDKDRVNELERQLNRLIQSNIANEKNIELLNPYKGKSVSKAIQIKRQELLTEKEIKTLEFLAKKATD